MKNKALTPAQIYKTKPKKSKSENKKYNSFYRIGNRVIPLDNIENILKTLEPNVYTLHHDQMANRFWFQYMEPVSDSILELPSSEYDLVLSEMTKFLTPEVHQKYIQYDFLYKRSVLLHGLPGTGKTILAQRLSKEVIKLGGVVFYVKDPNTLKIAFEIIKDTSPDLFTMVIFEEFDQIVEEYEDILLGILDGETQKNKMMVVATTNYINKIPARIQRPGRFSSIVEVLFPNRDARFYYFNYKLKDSQLADRLTDVTDGLSVDQLKEVIQAHIILEQPLDNVLKRIRSLTSADLADNLPRYNHNYDSWYGSDDD